jgi:hypothetical protein
VLFIYCYQLPVHYKKGLVSVEKENNGVIDVSFNGDNYYISNQKTTTIEKNGIKQKVVYIYYTDTIGTRYFSKSQNNKKYKEAINVSNGGQAIDKDISAVYYLDYSESKKQILDTSKLVLLWKK